MKIQSVFNKINNILVEIVRFYIKYAFLLLGLLLLSAFFSFIWGWGLADADVSTNIFDSDEGYFKDVIIYKIAVSIMQAIFFFYCFCCLVILIRVLSNLSRFSENLLIVSSCILSLLVIIIAFSFALNNFFVILLLTTWIISLILLYLHKIRAKNSGKDLFY